MTDKQATFVAALVNCDGVIALHLDQNELMHEMKRSLVHEQLKRIFNMTTDVQVTPEGFLVLVRGYYSATEKGLKKFKWEGHTLLVSYAKYLIEYLEPRFAKDERVSTRLYLIRKEAKRRAALKAAPPDESIM